MNRNSDKLDPAEVGALATAGGELADWRILVDTVQASFATGSMARGIEFAARVGAAADEMDHHPDLTITYPRVHVLLTSHDIDALSSRDVAAARRISQIAAELGIDAEPTAPMQLELAIDAMDIPAIRPFWRAVLGYRGRNNEELGEELVDPYGRGPAVWFQQMDAARPQRNRVHFDVIVPHDVAQQRVDDTIAAGGRLVADDRAPAFWVLADTEGNEACVCTWQGRSPQT